MPCLGLAWRHVEVVVKKGGRVWSCPEEGAGQHNCSESNLFPSCQYSLQTTLGSKSGAASVSQAGRGAARGPESERDWAWPSSALSSSWWRWFRMSRMSGWSVRSISRVLSQLGGDWLLGHCSTAALSLSLSQWWWVESSDTTVSSILNITPQLTTNTTTTQYHPALNF